MSSGSGGAKPARSSRRASASSTLSAAEIDWYVETGEPDGKAGAYAIQGPGSRFVDWIEGSWSNVVGLPVATVYRMLGGRGMLC